MKNKFFVILVLFFGISQHTSTVKSINIKREYLMLAVGAGFGALGVYDFVKYLKKTNKPMEMVMLKGSDYYFGNINGILSGISFALIATGITALLWDHIKG